LFLITIAGRRVGSRSVYIDIFLRIWNTECKLKKYRRHLDSFTTKTAQVIGITPESATNLGWILHPLHYKKSSIADPDPLYTHGTGYFCNESGTSLAKWIRIRTISCTIRIYSVRTFLQLVTNTTSDGIKIRRQQQYPYSGTV
jgi:hypothetical protein